MTATPDPALAVRSPGAGRWQYRRKRADRKDLRLRWAAQSQRRLQIESAPSARHPCFPCPVTPTSIP